MSVPAAACNVNIYLLPDICRNMAGSKPAIACGLIEIWSHVSYLCVNLQHGYLPLLLYVHVLLCYFIDFIMILPCMYNL